MQRCFTPPLGGFHTSSRRNSHLLMEDFTVGECIHTLSQLGYCPGASLELRIYAVGLSSLLHFLDYTC